MILAAQQTADGMEALQKALREDSERAEFFRNFAPFAGVLDKFELRIVDEICAFAH
jgi:hypothetical protein